MSTNEKLGASFDRLAQRLDQLQFDKNLDIHYDYVPFHSINDIIREGGILTSDLEDAQDLLLHYISEINKVIQSVPSIISRFTFSSKVLDWEKGDIITEDQIKQQVQDRISNELEYYKTELERLNEQVLAKNEELGDVRFASAGFKIKLNLKVEAVGGFFNALYESGVIINKNPDSSISLTKKELALFIQKNFSCTTTDNIGIESIKNSLSRKNADAEAEAIDRLYNFIKTPPQK